MNEFSFNGTNVILDDRLVAYERFSISSEFIIYQQFLSQLHLPFEKWGYDKGNKGMGLAERNPELEEMDPILFKELDYTKLVSPSRLYTYFLLQEYLGNGLNFKGMGIIRSRKSHFIYLDTPFSLESMKTPSFVSNDISRFLLKRTKKRELISVHETFFVLLGDKFRSKLLNALTLYQSETGNTVSKVDLMDTLLNPKRLEALRLFSQLQIERL